MTTWTVPAVVQRVVDADTLILDLDLGWGIWLRGKRCRLAGVNAPEMNTSQGVTARAFVVQRCPPLTRVTFVSRQLDKYGRPLGSVRLPDDSDLAHLLLAAGHAVRA